MQPQTTHVGLNGAPVGQPWDADGISSAVRAGARPRAATVYNQSEVILLDEFAQTPSNQMDTASLVLQNLTGSSELLGGGPRLAATGDPLQTPPVQEDESRRTMFWEGEAMQRAMAEGKLVRILLRGMYRTANPELLEFLTALRKEDLDRVVETSPAFEATEFSANETVQELVHDRSEIYAVADGKFGGRPGVRTYYARAEAVSNKRKRDE